jgi:hydrogenase maturation protease
LNDLVFAWGNPSRGDDALGPAFAAAVEAAYAAEIGAGALEVLTDFQLQVEHALDLQGRRRVFFVDATKEPVPFALRPLEPSRDASFTSHVLSPAALLHTFLQLDLGAPPACWLLTIGGERFELGEPLGERARDNLALALAAFAAHRAG